MITTLAFLAVFGGPPSRDWFGADKVKHFFVSAFIHSAAYSAARTMRLGRPSAQAIGGISAAGFGVWKEVRDRRSGKPFSVQDLAWDAGGALTAAALLNGTR